MATQERKGDLNIFDKTFNAKIYIGFNEEEKSEIMKEIGNKHYQTLYIHNDDLPINPVANELPNVRIEGHYHCTDLDRETDIREKSFNKCCIFVDEVLNPNKSFEVVFNRMSYYIKACEECIIFQYVPCIESINDFLLLCIQEHTKYGKKGKNIERQVTQDIIDELVKNDCIVVKPNTHYEAAFTELHLVDEDVLSYTKERNELFDKLKPNQDAVIVYNKLNVFVGKMKFEKMNSKRALFRAKTGGKTTFTDKTSEILPVCEFPIKRKAVTDYMCLNDTKRMEFWISNTNIDKYNKKIYQESFDDMNKIINMVENSGAEND